MCVGGETFSNYKVVIKETLAHPSKVMHNFETFCILSHGRRSSGKGFESCGITYNCERGTLFSLIFFSFLFWPRIELSLRMFPFLELALPKDVLYLL